MNRIIKFRAWEKERKVMQYPHQPDFSFYPIKALAEESSVFVFMQFTGLHDKNGREIYEGDVVEKCGVVREERIRNGLGPERGVVEFLFGAFTFHLLSIGRDGSGIEVIGNIYENPELLNKQA